MDIQWYPGHMKKTRDLISQNYKLVDLIVELLDARAPRSSLNPLFDDVLGDKKRLFLLNKSDLADPEVNKLWLDYYKKQNRDILLMNSKSGSTKGILDKIRQINAPMHEKMIEKGRKPRPVRMMILGVPNVGKSSLINRLAGRASAKTSDKPGVTRGKQWVRLGKDLELFDTPGILWPKFEDPIQGLNLALIGSIRDEILDRESLALELIGRLQKDYPGLLKERYGCDEEAESLIVMEKIALARGAILPGKQIDYERIARIVIDEFRGGVLGRISLERPEDGAVEGTL